MNKILFFAISLMLCLSACTSDSAANKEAASDENHVPASEKIKANSGNSSPSADTNVEVPQWVADILKADSDQTRVMKCVFKGNNMYLINTCISCPTQLTEVFDDSQTLICRIGGADMKITCDENEFGAEGQRDCKPVFLKDKMPQ